MLPAIKPGIYTHYKNSEKQYRVLGVATHTESGEYMVVYQALYSTEDLGDQPLFVRPYEMFIEDVEVDGKRVPRFTYIGAE